MEQRVSYIGNAQVTSRIDNTPILKNLSDNRDRYIAQSILTGVVDKPELPTVEQARDIIAWAGRRAA